MIQSYRSSLSESVPRWHCTVCQAAWTPTPPTLRLAALSSAFLRSPEGSLPSLLEAASRKLQGLGAIVVVVVCSAQHMLWWHERNSHLHKIISSQIAGVFLAFSHLSNNGRSHLQAHQEDLAPVVVGGQVRGVELPKQTVAVRVLGAEVEDVQNSFSDLCPLFVGSGPKFVLHC